jgi:hypothetical protein
LAQISWDFLSSVPLMLVLISLWWF